MIGRPTKLDDLSERRILDALRAGNTRRAASEAAGIASSTFFAWCERGRKGEAPYSEFLDRLKRAEAEAEIALVVIVSEASHKSWQAAAWLLERRHAEWRPPQVQAQKEAFDAAANPTQEQRFTAEEWKQWQSMEEKFNDPRNVLPPFDDEGRNLWNAILAEKPDITTGELQAEVEKQRAATK